MIKFMNIDHSSSFPSILVHRENEPQNPQKLTKKEIRATQEMMPENSARALTNGLTHS